MPGTYNPGNVKKGREEKMEIKNKKGDVLKTLRVNNLRGADLQGSNLWGASLVGTCLDPENEPNQPEQFKTGIGYRTRKAGHIDKYRDGNWYSADVFSTCETECHPGLYLWPTLDEAIKFSGRDNDFIKVKTDQRVCHKAGTKYRTKWFYVIGSVETS